MMDAAKTPEERKAIMGRYPDLYAAKDQNLRDNFMAVGGGQEWDTQAGMMRNVPQRLIDLRTNTEVGQRNASGDLPTVNSKADMDKLPKGAQFIGVDGKLYTKN
jgi:hypothetical protein